MGGISKEIEKSGAWEKNIVNSVIRAMKAHPSAVFLDFPKYYLNYLLSFHRFLFKLP